MDIVSADIVSPVFFSYVVIGVVALLASALTFFSGFGLGTLLLPAFALFVPVEQAVALTAIVHFLNNLLKLGLIGRHADWRIVWRFGVPAIVMSVAGAALLIWLGRIAPVYDYSAFGHELAVTPIKLVMGVLLLLFAAIELVPRLRDRTFGTEYMPLGGALSGFFGGLSGMQGALRSAFLARAGLSKEAFIGTGVVIACLIDVSRLGVYATSVIAQRATLDLGLLAVAIVAAFAGAVLGNRHLHKVTMPGVQKLVALLLVLIAFGLIAGIL